MKRSFFPLTAIHTIARIVLILALVIHSASADAAVLQVGAGKTYAKIAAAIAAARAGDTIEIAPGTYLNDAAQIQKDLTIRGVGATRPKLKSTKLIANRKGIFVVGGAAKVVVENLEFSGARVSDGNGAGIRMQGKSLDVRGCFFHDNENGILAGGSTAYTVLVERSEFAANGVQGSGYQHNIYISGDCIRFTFRYNYSHHAKSGHNLKSRAKLNYILYNRLMDETTGSASYTIDLPQGGRSYVIGNLLQQGPKAENRGTMLSYKGEGATNPLLELFVVNNTFVNDNSAKTSFVRAKSATKVWLLNNLFVGQGDPIALGSGATSAEIKKVGNLQPTTAVLVNRSAYDYHLKAGASAIDAATAPGSALGYALLPTHQYVHPARTETRPQVGILDVGAYEYGKGKPAGDSGPAPGSDSGPKDAGRHDGETVGDLGQSSDLGPGGDGAKPRDSSLGTGDSANDAGAASPPGGGCACGLDAPRDGSGLPWLVLLVAALASRRRQRSLAGSGNESGDRRSGP